ncbi:MAG TPA: RNA 2',3'-cyclic phosphodiesterase [Geminicoccus sp.]|jgi:2'-5' RNA ligase|uniref:RNA 2',3'-cyclic phosphodiesterase n=1 Tax=Geminicoccus sp. TaxID=2024832 RepID=UPI002E2EA9C8|nr:RNA 2',3'-cyclic phosphodiesterase [Geminicoccus sp.]HEX2529480.1 RNA 2',3'-cyclic phosphodiesterase [Geminicoccus sp.]
MPRIYIALDLPEDVVDQVDRLCVGLPDVRWTDADDLHVTLRFIGEVDHATFEEIGEALADVSAPPFDLQLQGVGHFPPRGQPTTLWLGVAPSEGLQTLKRRVDRHLASLGIPADPRKYAPHLTIARIRAPLPESRFGSFLKRLSLYRSEPFSISGFTLYSSLLRTEGAIHTPEARYDFVQGVAERV